MILKNANLFVCSSIFEGYSTVVKECLLLGVPVLTTDCAGMDEMLENGKYGIVVPNNDQALLEGLEKFLANPHVVKIYRENIKSNRVSIGKELKDYEIFFVEFWKKNFCFATPSFCP